MLHRSSVCFPYFLLSALFYLFTARSDAKPNRIATFLLNHFCVIFCWRYSFSLLQISPDADQILFAGLSVRTLIWLGAGLLLLFLPFQYFWETYQWRKWQKGTDSIWSLHYLTTFLLWIPLWLLLAAALPVNTATQWTLLFRQHCRNFVVLDCCPENACRSGHLSASFDVDNICCFVVHP